MSDVPPTRLLLVITPYFAEAELVMQDRVLPAHVDWIWLASERIAMRWLSRCKRRGQVIDPTWLYANDPTTGIDRKGAA